MMIITVRRDHHKSPPQVHHVVTTLKTKRLVMTPWEFTVRETTPSWTRKHEQIV